MDLFDEQLKSLATILIRGVGTADSYGVAPPELTTVATNVPCRVSLGRGRPKELKAEKKIAENYKCVFMRPWFADPPTNSQPLTHNHWLEINGQLYDIFQIDDPSLLGHHLEVWCELILR